MSRRMIEALGENVPGPVPPVIPCSAIHVTASV